MRRELKGMGLNCYVALGKPVIIESYRKNHPTFTQDDPGSSPCWGEMSKDHLSVQKYKRQTPPWKRRLEAQIKTARREVSQLSEAKKGNMKKQVPKRYSQMPIDEALETAKQRLQTLASRLKRYSRENEAKRLNHPVSSQPAHMYAQEQGNNIRGDILRPDTEQQTDCEPPPNSQDSGWTGDLEGETTCRGARADQQMEPGCSSGVHNDGEWHP
ncbi:uncharacterized protein LOC129456254 [Periophthalmus magnuspinnatus]|uniref:uncharacterized protein LOC129456254 n=1 Tax=Periophthalmus magnuspinnatus TaxID=409849 RepID=UPI002436E99D|nr:uncharacterized protein LOC129456254 [Periophthalmus magnuspinnatus]